MKNFSTRGLNRKRENVNRGICFHLIRWNSGGADACGSHGWGPSLIHAGADRVNAQPLTGGARGQGVGLARRRLPPLPGPTEAKAGALPAPAWAAPAVSDDAEHTGELRAMRRIRSGSTRPPRRGGAEGRPRRWGLQRRRLVEGHGPGGAPAMSRGEGETRRSGVELLVVEKGRGKLGFGLI